MLGPGGSREREMHRPHRFVLTAAPWPGDAGGRQPQGSAGAVTDALGHRAGHLFAHCAVGGDERARHPEELALRLVTRGYAPLKEPT